MKNKGFTLVELIATITILVILGIIAATSITRIVNNAKASNYTKQINMIEESFKLYVNDNIDNMPQNTESLSMSLYQLKQTGYADKSIVNPKDNKEIANDSILTVYNNDGKYEFSFKEGTDTSLITNTDLYIDVNNLVKHLNQNDIYDVNITNIVGTYTLNSTTIEKVTYNNKELTYITVSSIDTSLFGKYRVTYNVTSNSKTYTLSKSVMVRDYVEPTITFNNETCGSTVDYSIYKTFKPLTCVSASDNDGATVNLEYKGKLANKSGKQYITYIATDSSGNKSVLRKAFSLNLSTLVTELKKQYNSTNTVGLLKDDTGYYYKGTNAEVSKNFVWWAGILWRVMSIDNSDNITMISSGPLTSIQPAESVWTTKDMYDNSYINIWLNSTGADGVLYKGLTEADKAKIVDSTFNVGIYTNPSEITTTGHFGLVDYNNYLKAGGATSYINIKDYFWSSNRYNDSNVYCITENGSFSNCYSSDVVGIRVVVKISDLTIITGNNTLGTLTNPYKEISLGTNTNNIKVGEYISLPYSSSIKYCNSTSRCLFKVISVDSNSIKISLNGVLNSESQFGTTTTYTGGNTVDTLVSEFLSTISSTYKYTGNDKVFGIGNYGWTSGVGINYKVVKMPTIIQNYGLPVVGELFTANDIDMSYPVTDSKIFVDSNVIENAFIVHDYWTVNLFNSTSVRCVGSGSGLSNPVPSSLNGVRPVLYLKKGTDSSLTFTGGDGTANNPYMLGS